MDNKRLAVMRDSIPGDMRSSYTQQCYPLYSLLQALGNHRVDLLSLDIEESQQSRSETRTEIIIKNLVPSNVIMILSPDL